MGAIDTLPVNEQIETIYFGYLGRAADSGGLAFWDGQYVSALAAGQSPDQALNNISNSFVPQAESLALYPYLSTPVDLLSIAQLDTLVSQIYENLFDRAATSGDTGYWVPRLQSGAILLGDSVIAIANGAIGTDLTTLDNKITVATAFTSETGAIGLGNGFEDQALTQVFKTEAHIIVQSVTSNPESVTEAIAAKDAFIANGGTAITGPGLPGTPNILPLTIGQDTLTGFGNDVFSAPLAPPSGGNTGELNTLNASDSLTEISPATGAVLNADFFGTPFSQPNSVNIEGIATWNIYQEDYAYSTGDHVDIVGGVAGSPQVISGLRTLNYYGNTTESSLNLGTNAQPINVPSATDNFQGTPADGFQINVYDVVGSPSTGVDVDMWYGDFFASTAAGPGTGAFIDSTIFVTATDVGLFPIGSNQSPVVPPPILVKGHDGDDYDPNWQGYLANAYSIAAGASVSGTPAVGFTTWVVTSLGSSSGLNIIALGGDGSGIPGESATTLDVLNPPSTALGSNANTMLFATSISDSLSTDWANLVNIDLSQTRGFVTLTGLETDIQGLTEWGFLHAMTIDEAINYFGSLSAALAYVFQQNEGGGLLSSDTAALMSIVGGTGNSFYDLSSLTLAAAEAGSFQGGTSTNGNSEISFNNYVMTEGGAANGGTTPINISNVQILDDVSATFTMTVPTSIYSGAGGSSTATLPDNGEAQGGVINMQNFSTLQPLNVNYALLAEDLHPSLSAPNGLPFTVAQYSYNPPPLSDAYTLGLTALNHDSGVIEISPISQASLLPATVSVADALDYQNGVVPAGFYFLQFLNAEGSTQTVLGADLTVYDNFVNFAINAQDLADGYNVDGIDISFWIPTPANTESVDGSSTYGFEGSLFTLQGFDMTFWAFGNGATTVNTADTFTLFVSDDGATLFGCQQLLDILFPGQGDSLLPLTGDSISEQNIGFIGQALYVPHFTVDNVTTVNIVLPYESPGFVFFDRHNGSGDHKVILDLQNYVILGASLLSVPNNGAGTGSFTDQPVVTVTDATVNFFDNHADNGGSPPGGADNLVLGDTNFTDLLVPIPDVLATSLPYTLFPAAIGYMSVFVDGTTSADGQASTTINDFGAGSLEIGATNASMLHAQSTSHLIMDLPGTLNYVGTSFYDQGAPATGITVDGSFIGQNLLQGTSGTVEFDYLFGHPAPINPYGFVVNLGVYETQLQADGANGGWGNDTLSGGAGWGDAFTYSVGGVATTIYTLGVSNLMIDGGYTNGPGNTGDNFFTEGGIDTVNISPYEQGVLTGHYQVWSSSGTVLLSFSNPYDNESTVWVGFYDVCNSAGPNASYNNLGYPDSGVGTVLAQAITDINDVGLNAFFGFPPAGYGVEMFVDGYGNSPFGVAAAYDNPFFPPSDYPVVTINGFHLGGNGDTIVFTPGDWASSLLSLFPTAIPTFGGPGWQPGAIAGLVESDGQTLIGLDLGPQLGRGADMVVIGTGALPAPPAPHNGWDVIGDNIGGIIPSAQALASDLGTAGTDIILNGTGVAADTQVDILVAYTTGTSINIADVNLTNDSGASITDTALLHPVAHDLVHITTTLGLSNLNNGHNIWFVG
jgi:hypothetical protein